MNPDSIRTRLSSIAAVAAVIVVGAVAIVIATGGPPSAESSSSGASASSGASSTAGDKVDIANFKYAPPDLSVSAGSKVTFTNSDSAAHTATSKTGGVFDTNTLQQGDSKAVTLSKPGTYPYYCRFHAFMSGTITVK